DTAFYPEGGGQTADHGTLDKAKVSDVKRVHGVIVHYTDAELAVGSKVTGKIDWDRRFDNMQNHSGEHLLSGIIHAKLKYDNVGFHMDDSVITVDFNGPITPEQLAGFEKEANDAIAKDVPLDIAFPSAEELEKLDYRSKKELSGRVRIVTIPGYDSCACCGTHVARTGEIGILKCLSLAKHRGGVRIEFVCGRRAWLDYSKKVEEAHAVSMLLSAKPNEISGAVQKVLDEVAARDQKIAQINERYFRLKASTVPAGQKFALFFEDGLSQIEIKKFCNLLVEEKRAGVCAVLSPAASGNAWNYIVASDTTDLKAIGKDLNKALNGRGGGNGKFVQGTYQAAREEIEQKLKEAFS
ncbi:MAG: alanyl-tRNA editing protein, partial [Sutterellaceae bacterium]|nr:alanyl-tRNA editing protein [Sutterellaceae bacterium]